LERFHITAAAADGEVSGEDDLRIRMQERKSHKQCSC